MREQGRLIEWNDDRGFGFVTPLGSDVRVFAHVSQFPRSQRRPMLSDLVSFETRTDERGRKQAHAIQFMAPTRERGAKPFVESPRPAALSMPALAVACVVLVAVAVLAFIGFVPWFIPVAYLVMSLLTFAVYGQDKSAAEQHEWRVSEATLHLLAVLGGWPGALVAQQVFRHKTRKLEFQVIFWITVIVNLGLLVFIGMASASTASPA